MGKKERDWLESMTPEQKAEYMYQYLVVGDVMNRVDEYMGIKDFKACSTLHRYYGFGGINHGLYKDGYQGKTVTKEDFAAFLSLCPNGLPQEQVIVNNAKNQGDVFRAFLDDRYEMMRQEEAKRKAERAKEEELLRKQQEAARASQNSAKQQTSPNTPTMESFSPPTTASSEEKGGMGMIPMVVGGLAVAYALFTILF